MKQYNIYGEIDNLNDNDLNSELEEKTSYSSKKSPNADRYFGSDLNKFAALNCRKDIVINNIDLIVNNYKDNTLKIVESKHLNEKLSTGQKLLLQKLSKMGIDTFVVYGNYPYKDWTFTVYSFQTNATKQGTTKELYEFLQR